MVRPLARLTALELTGLVLVGAWILWAAIASVLGGVLLSPISPYVMAPVSLILGVVVGRLLADSAADGAVAWSLLGIMAVLLLGVLSTSGPGKGPLGYANANAAVAVQLIGVCGVVGFRARARANHVAIALAVLCGVAVVLANASRAGTAVALGVVVVVAAMGVRPVSRRIWSLLAVTAGMVIIAASAYGVWGLASGSRWPSWLERVLDPTRRLLWEDALDLWVRHPWVGAGPGAFERTSRLGDDADTASAHSSILQVGAETGWVGVALLGLIIIAGLLWVTRGAAPLAVVAAASWTALLVHSFVDHLLDFPPVVIVAGAVIGWAGSTARSEQLDVAEGQGPRGR